MIQKTKLLVALTSLMLAGSFATQAGNKDRVGQAGATELTINPWSRSSGWAGANTASVKGLEAMYGNIAGTAGTSTTELLVVNTKWLSGTGTSINAFGLTQHVGSGAIGLGIMAMGFGDIDITTTESPEGNIGKFSPQYINVNLSYAHKFSDNISGGVNFKSISEQISDLRAQGMALDAGIQYVAMDKLHFGISLRNIGPKMTYRGDGLAVRVPLLNDPNNTAQTMSVEQKSAAFELPSMVNIGLAYDFYLISDSTSTDAKMHRLTAAGNFTSNSFGKDEIKLGVEYAWKSMFMLRAGYNYEKGIMKSEGRTSAHTGPCFGATVEAPFKKGKQAKIGIDYSYRTSNPFSGTHSIGVRITL